VSTLLPVYNEEVTIEKAMQEEWLADNRKEKQMLERQDLEAIRGIVREEIKESHDSLRDELREEFRKEIKESHDNLRDELRKEFHEEIHENSNMILRHVDKVQGHLENKIQELRQELKAEIRELRECYQTLWLENSNQKLLFQLVAELRKDVDELKERTA